MSLLDAVAVEQTPRTGVWCKQSWLRSCVDYRASVEVAERPNALVVELLDLEVQAPDIEQELALVMAEHEVVAEFPAELDVRELPLAQW